MISKRHKKLIEVCANYSNDAYKKTVDGIFIEDKDTDTQAYISYKDNDIIISGQGTTSMKDWSIDFQIWREKADFLNDTLVHAGFLKAYKSIRMQLHVEINKIKVNENNTINRIICTGHSLFGALATLCSVDCALMYDYPVHCVTFGSPRVGAPDFIKLYNNNIDVSYRCVRFKDPVSFTPLPLRFRHVRGGVHFDKDYKNLSRKTLSVYNCIGCRVKHHSMDDYYDFCCEMNK